MNRLPILAICGSLRADSLTGNLMDLTERIAPDLQFLGRHLVGRLPLYNADLDSPRDLPAVVGEFRIVALAAKAVIIASPEYVYGPSGVTKNALDWLMGNGRRLDLPVLLLSASQGETGGLRGLAALIDPVQQLGGRLLDPMTFAHAAGRFGAHGQSADHIALERLELALEQLRLAVATPLPIPGAQLLRPSPD